MLGARSRRRYPTEECERQHEGGSPRRPVGADHASSVGVLVVLCKMRLGTRSTLPSLARSTAVIRDLERKVPVPTLTVLVLVSAMVVLGWSVLRAPVRAAGLVRHLGIRTPLGRPLGRSA